MRYIAILLLALLVSCTLDETSSQIQAPREYETQNTKETEVFVVESSEPQVRLGDLPGEYQAAAGLSWCPEGEVQDVQGMVHIYRGIVNIQIRGQQVQACEVEGSLDGERIFLAYSTQDESLSRTVMYLGESEDGIAERWKEGTQFCEQMYDVSGSPLNSPQCS
jgi:hypothetical protein